MAKINIVIADSDELFLQHLINYLMGHMNTLNVYSFTTKESMAKFIGERTNKVDILAFTEDLMDESVNLSNIPAKIIIGDGSFALLEGFDTVNKYQKAEKFINDILMIYAEKTGHVEAVSTGDKETKVVGFFSPVGGSGKTTLALATAYALGVQGKKVFYLNAEKLNSTAEYLNDAANGNMSDIYLTAKTKGGNIGLRIVADRYTDSETNITYINPSESSLEINEITFDEFKKILEAFETLGEFDTIVVDFDGEFNNDKIKLLECMDKVFVPFVCDKLSVSKIKLMYKELGMYDELRQFEERFYPVVNKADRQSDAYLQSVGLSEICSIAANIPLSPVFQDIQNVFHSENNIAQIMSGIIGNIQG
jgi:cellulose biosynthesis protein BcsQ